MKLSIGIVGLPNVGKSTLFNLLTKNEAKAENYPFCTIDPNVGIVEVPDERLDKLSKLSESAKTIPAIVEFLDIAGIVKGANKGAGLGNQFLAHIREVGVILIVLRSFEGDTIHIEGSVDPLRDLETINTELALKDLETIEKRLEALKSKLKAGDKEAMKEKEVLGEIKKELEKGKIISPSHFASLYKAPRNDTIKNLGLLTMKKQIYLFNGEIALNNTPSVIARSENETIPRNDDYIVVDLKSANHEVALVNLVKTAYKTLELVSFFTTGEKETRAWTTFQGATAPQAAGVIHSDFEQKFIRAEVINCKDLITAGSWTVAKSKGLIRIEGKQYLIKDGDVVLFRHG